MPTASAGIVKSLSSVTVPAAMLNRVSADPTGMRTNRFQPGESWPVLFTRRPHVGTERRGRQTVLLVGRVLICCNGGLRPPRRAPIKRRHGLRVLNQDTPFLRPRESHA